MNPLTRLSPLLMSGALLALAAAPATAATSITNVRLNSTNRGLDLVLDTQGGNGDVFTVHQGNTLRADLTRTQLDLPEGNFQQDNPAPGIASISVVPLDATSVRVTIEGTDQAPTSQIHSRRNRVVLSLRPDGETRPTSIPETLVTVPGPETPALAQAETTETIPVTPPPAQPDVLVPNPEVVIDGVPVAQPQLQQAPPFLPRAVAPPVGDMSFAESVTTFSTIDLGTNERIPRLLLRDAPAREVLGLLARAAGMNLVYAPGADEGGEEGSSNTLVSLDIENESVQDVFNHVLRVSGLQANKVGRSIYVSPQLPNSAQNLVTRTLRLNQVDAGVASNFLVALGAESAISRERLVTNVNAVEVTEGAPPVTQTETTTVEQVEIRRVDYEDSQAVLRGLQVIADERTNSVTLVGRADLVAMATEQLTRIDIRRRQVAINLRVIDVNLSSIDSIGSSLSFTSGNFSINILDGLVNGGRVIFNRGGSLPTNFIAQLTASVTSGNAKILTDPTLIVQEGQQASVAITTDVITNVTIETVDGPGGSRETRTFEIEPAGLILQVNVNRIDDNGFVSLSVAPSISAPLPIINTGAGSITPLARRSISSGQVRVRDGQTLLLSGIIQETERSTVTKIPILGDIPILGALFRRSEVEDDRQELIVLLTPQILDDSDQAVWGYRYTPSEQVQEILDNQQR